MVYQQGHHAEVTPISGDRERTSASVILYIHCGAILDQHLHYLCVPILYVFCVGRKKNTKKK